VVGFGFVVWLPLTPALPLEREPIWLVLRIAFDSVLLADVPLASSSVSSLSLRERARVRVGFVCLE